MKKISLIIACVGFVSITAFGSGLRTLTNPQEDTKNAKVQVAPKKDANGKPIEVARPLQKVTGTPANTTKADSKVNEVKKTPSKEKAAEVPKNKK